MKNKMYLLNATYYWYVKLTNEGEMYHINHVLLISNEGTSTSLIVVVVLILNLFLSLKMPFQYMPFLQISVLW